MINIGIIHTGRLENIENHRDNNPSLFRTANQTDEYKLNFITSTWKENYEDKKTLFETSDDVKKISDVLILNDREEMYNNLLSNSTMNDYIKKYITKHTPFTVDNQNEDEFYSHLVFNANQYISQFWLLYNAIKNDTKNDFYIKLRTDTNLNHLNIKQYIELCIELFCFKEGRFNNTFIDWFDLKDINKARKEKLVHMKIMFEGKNQGFIKDQFFAFNYQKAEQIKTNFVENISQIVSNIEDKGKLTGEGIWYELLSMGTYVLNDDWQESIDSN
jgi:hypothetical protein